MYEYCCSSLKRVYEYCCGSLKRRTGILRGKQRKNKPTISLWSTDKHNDHFLKVIAQWSCPFLPCPRESSGTACARHDLVHVRLVSCCSSTTCTAHYFGTCTRSCSIYPFFPWRHEQYWRRRHGLLWQVLPGIKSAAHISYIYVFLYFLLPLYYC